MNHRLAWLDPVLRAGLRGLVLVLLLAAPGPRADAQGAPDAKASENFDSASDTPPGVVIDKSPDAGRIFFGSPSLAILPDGSYVASHDYFGPGATDDTTVVFASQDHGETWQKLGVVIGQYWSTLFIHRGILYLLGTSKYGGNVVIRRSEDGGRTWTKPPDEHTGLLLKDGRFTCAPTPVLVHNGRLWRAFEELRGQPAWGYCAMVISAPLDADLLAASAWTASERVPWSNWWPADGWLEGNIVRSPEGGLVDIMRVDEPRRGGKAAMLHVSADGTRLTFDPATGFIAFPGGCKKFTIRYDPTSGLYWSLTNYEVDDDRRRAVNAERQRNTLVLTASRDLRHWNVRALVLYHPDVQRVGFQYVDWRFEGDDIIAVSRTAFGEATDCHDANYLTFHRITGFRQRTFQRSRSPKEVSVQSSDPAAATSDAGVAPEEP